MHADTNMVTLSNIAPDTNPITLTDFLDVDPATRYSVARNAFGRALTDARAMNDLKYLLADNAPANIQMEANKYFKKEVCIWFWKKTPNESFF